MRSRIGLSFVLASVAGVALAAPSGALGATTLGATTPASGASPGACNSDQVIAQVTSDPSTPYSAPGSGTITQWQINASFDLASHAVTLVVLRPVGASFTVLGVDPRSIPYPAPPVATYTLATPIAVSAGDTLGLYTNTSGPPACYFNGGSTSTADTLAALTAASAPAPNQTLNRNFSDSPAGYTMNLAATFEPTPTPPVTPKKKCKKHRKKHKSAAAAKKKHCKKKKKKR
jgi:hypothetical protein